MSNLGYSAPDGQIVFCHPACPKDLVKAQDKSEIAHSNGGEVGFAEDEDEDEEAWQRDDARSPSRLLLILHWIHGDKII
jgi:formate hydrogenlyase subunit 6/NADH:ubiquinone oxidoreductase subunit I